jgi:2-polyprenyl-3-methyl-5-hydroxy-6-metoxy-1,4-benzoquinol methylase
MTDKRFSYFEQSRPELVRELPQQLGLVLDVGCGAGGVGRALRDRADTLTGVELVSEAAEAAEAVYDRVERGSIEEALPELGGPFDTILAYDVLEHLVDPGPVLEGLRGLAAPGALLHVSVPNARHWSLVRDLVLRGTFGYTEWGHRDRTHLRWFTPSDLSALLTDAGWIAERSGHAPLSSAGRALERLTRGRSSEFLVYQWWALGRAR